MLREELDGCIDQTLEGLDEGSLRKAGVPGRIPLLRGKVRDILDLGDELVIVTSDRVSAFDRVLTTIPCKGQVLNQISLFWFRETRDIVPNHVLSEISPRAVRVRKCPLVPLEIVVRGYLTGSAWRDYEAGRTVSGFRLPEGMRFNEKFPEPLLTPSTKAEKGAHDRPVSRDRILEEGIVSEETWNRLEETAQALYRRGAELVRKSGLILVDTKYEFGYGEDGLLLVDEIHTPDSSRYWYADSYEERFAGGEYPRELDKEYLRRWLMDRGFQGDGEPPAIPDSIRIDVAERYVTAFEAITGTRFEAAGQSPEQVLKSVADLFD